MTGIFVFYSKNDSKNHDILENMAKENDHRGGICGTFLNETNIYAKITFNQAQSPNINLLEIIHNDKRNFVGLDGQIFNLDKIRNQILKKKPELDSKFNPIYQGFKLFGISFFQQIEGIFSLIIKDGPKIIAVKDPIGSKPLYIIDTTDYIAISSELKSLTKFSGIPRYLQPGQAFIFDGTRSSWETYTSIIELNKSLIKSWENLNEITTSLANLVNNAVKNAINIPGKVSALLSGGIDSTIICAVAKQYLPKLDVYTVAVEGSEDLKYAKLFAEANKETLSHHIFQFTLDDMLKILPKVIYQLETFDAALIRSAVPMYYIASKIDPNTAVLLTGEGGDELFGGYDYLKDLDDITLNQELTEMLHIEHATGLQRVDRIPYAFGIEARAPWFDYNIVKYAFQIPVSMKIRKTADSVMEKWIIRETFKDKIPAELIWRKKEKFSQGVGSQFFLRDYINSRITDEEFALERQIFPNIFVKSKEELYYWRIFKEAFDPKELFIRTLPRTANFTL